MVARWEENYLRLKREWEEMAAKQFSFLTSESWKYNNGIQNLSRSSGYKIHVTATVSNCAMVGEIVGTYCNLHGLAGKCPKSILHVKKINSGQYGYGQIGKIFTIYLEGNERQHVSALKDILFGFSGPKVPFDVKVMDSSNLYYRYGSFAKGSSVEINGRVIFDDRNCPIPDGICPLEPIPLRSAKSDLRGSLIYECLSQRGKGGVYRSITMSPSGVVRTIIKEGRKDGEEGWLGLTGSDLISNEYIYISAMSSSGMCPKIVDRFDSNKNSYLVMEDIPGENVFKSYSIGPKSCRNVKYAKDAILKISSGVDFMHRKGIYWRDLKPHNLIQDGRKIIFIDFEGAVKKGEKYLEPWGSPLFSPVEWGRADERAAGSQDIYAMGKTIEFILCGRFARGRRRRMGKKLGRVGRGEEDRLMIVINAMTRRAWSKRPNAAEVKKLIIMALKNRKKR